MCSRALDSQPPQPHCDGAVSPSSFHRSLFPFPMSLFPLLPFFPSFSASLLCPHPPAKLRAGYKSTRLIFFMEKMALCSFQVTSFIVGQHFSGERGEVAENTQPKAMIYGLQRLFSLNVFSLRVIRGWFSKRRQLFHRKLLISRFYLNKQTGNLVKPEALHKKKVAEKCKSPRKAWTIPSPSPSCFISLFQTPLTCWLPGAFF